MIIRSLGTLINYFGVAFDILLGLIWNNNALIALIELVVQMFWKLIQLPFWSEMS